jgi:GNAT superfamily N-acetyltransferase
MTAKGLTVVGPFSITFVAIDEASPAVICAYYALTLTEVDCSLMPTDKRNKFPRRIPGVRLARLAVRLSHQKKGLGELLMVNALERASRVHTEAGGIGLFVDAIDEQAAAFYRHYGVVASPEQPLLIFLSVGSLT